MFKITKGWFQLMVGKSGKQYGLQLLIRGVLGVSASWGRDAIDYRYCLDLELLVLGFVIKLEVDRRAG